MLLGIDPRHADHAGHPVGKELHEWAGILVGHDPRDGPHGRGVFGRERRTAFPELSIAVVLHRALTSRGKFERLHGDQAVDSRLSTEKAGLTLVFVMSQKP